MINTVVLTGRITKDLELYKTQSGINVLKFSLAVDKREKESKPNFIPIVVWDKGAEYLHKYAHKGTLIALTGRIETRTYQDKSNRNVYVTEVIADHTEILRQPQNTRGNEYEIMNGETFDTGEPLDLTEDRLPF